jgi:hypothetical protein
MKKHSAAVVISENWESKAYTEIASGELFDAVCPCCGQTRVEQKLFAQLPPHGTVCENCR